MGPRTQVLPAKRREGNRTEWYLKTIRNQNREHLVNLCESSTLETQVIAK